MKRLLTLLFALMLCIPAALAEEDAAPMTGQTTILAQQDAFLYIHQYIAPNGKPLYFTAEMPDPPITLEDVNFDGYQDVVVLTIDGASNAYFEFYVYDPATDAYQWVWHPGMEGGLANYRLYPAQGVVTAHANNGAAGALHEDYLYTWEGNELKLIRSVIAEDLTVTEYDAQKIVTTIYDGVLHITVRDHQAEGETILWEQTVLMEDADFNEIFAKEEELLWQGIR